jgi:hypothetical protein
MGRHTYYCEILGNYGDYTTGVYKVVADKEINGRWFPQLNRVMSFSDRVWKQGPKGGVKIVKSRSWPYPVGYITTDEKWMKKFTWIKLKAQAL